MIVPIYITVIVLAAIASHTALRYRGRGDEWAEAVALLYNLFALLAFAILGFASLNIELLPHVGSEAIVPVEQYYLGLLWFLAAIGNLVFVIAGVAEQFEIAGIPLIGRNS